MKEKLYISQAVVVEGKYDKIKLESLLDTLILTTNGFSIFNNSEQRALLRSLAVSRGLVVLTDSDTGGFRIRGYLSGVLGNVKDAKVTHVYIPEIVGRERRKSRRSAEGKLGVEGMELEVLRRAFTQAGVTQNGRPQAGLTSLDLYNAGLSGGTDSAALRRRLCGRLNLPAQLRSNALLPLLNCMLTPLEFWSTVEELRREEDDHGSK